MPIPPLTWVRCECGCGYEGPDEVGDFLLLEHAMIKIDGEELVENIAALKQRELQTTAQALKDQLKAEGWG